MHKFEASVPQFDHFAPEFRCCCGSVHVTQGTQMIGVVQLILAVFSCIALFFGTELSAMWRSLEISSLLVEVAVLVALFFALKKADSKLLLPYLIYEGLWILISIVVIILSFYTFLKPGSDLGHMIRGQLVEISFLETKDERSDDSIIRLSALFTILSFIIGSVVSIWWISVVYKCYNYFKKLAQVKEDTEISMRYSPQASV